MLSKLQYKAAFCQVNTSVASEESGQVGGCPPADEGIGQPVNGQFENQPTGVITVSDHAMSCRTDAGHFPTPKVQIVAFGNDKRHPNTDRCPHLADGSFADESLGAPDGPHRGSPHWPKGGVGQEAPKLPRRCAIVARDRKMKHFIFPASVYGSCLAIDGMLIQHLDRDIPESGLVGCRQYDRRCSPGFERLFPAKRAKTPPVTGPKAWKPGFGTRCA